MKTQISRTFRRCLTFASLALSPVLVAAESPRSGETGKYRNLFTELLGKTEEEVDAKIQAAFRQFFYGDPWNERIYYPNHDGTAFMPDVGNRDVRSEGISYGMMIAVQLDKQDEFNRLWKFARTHMYHEEGPLRGYFTWHTAYDGSMTRQDGSRIFGNGPAPDGEVWFVTGLFFASHRWGDGEGIYNYSQEAQSLLRTMIHKDREEGRGNVTSMFNGEAKQIVFTPDPRGSTHTDPSYHTPAFFELWARWAKEPEDKAFMREVTDISRGLFKKAAHPETGLMPCYSHFDGTLLGRPGYPDEFREDAWRTLSNPALDWSWWGADEWQVEQSNRVLAFFAKHPADDWADHMQIDGTVVRHGENSPGLYAMAAAAGLAADPEIAKPFVQRLWDLPVPSDFGRDNDGIREPGSLRSWRYYDGLLYMFGLLQAGGQFRIYGPK